MAGNRALQPTSVTVTGAGRSQTRRYPTVGRSSHISLELFARTFYSAPLSRRRAYGRGGNILVITITITVARLARELQKERDLSAAFIGDPSSGPQNVIVQRQLVDQVPVHYQAGAAEANAGRYSERVRAALARVRQRLAGLDADRRAIDAPRLGLAYSLGSSARRADNR